MQPIWFPDITISIFNTELGACLETRGCQEATRMESLRDSVRSTEPSPFIFLYIPSGRDASAF